MKYHYHLLKKPIPNREITARARETLRGNWGNAILISVLIPVIFGIFQMIVKYAFNRSAGFTLPAIMLVIISVSTVIANFYSSMAVPVWFLFLQRREPVTATEAFCTAFSRFWTAFLSGILAGLIVFLKLLLFIIPGILAAYDYILVYFCIADDPCLSPGQALKRSRAIMHGHRWQFFCFSWRFVGWAILCLLTLGIGFIWLIPYITAAMTEFYRSVMPAEDDEESGELPESNIAPYFSSRTNTIGFIVVVAISIIFSSLQNYFLTTGSCTTTVTVEECTNNHDTGNLPVQ